VFFSNPIFLSRYDFLGKFTQFNFATAASVCLYLPSPLSPLFSSLFSYFCYCKHFWSSSLVSYFLNKILQSTGPPNRPLITLEFTLDISQHPAISQPTSAIPSTISGPPIGKTSPQIVTTSRDQTHSPSLVNSEPILA